VISFSFGFRRGKPSASPATPIYLKMLSPSPYFLFNLIAESLAKVRADWDGGYLGEKPGAPDASLGISGWNVAAVYIGWADEVS
jgi:hypothetical protein